MSANFDSYNPKKLFNLEGRVVLITGGGTGIGLNIARGMAAAGAKVYIAGRRFEVLEKATEEWIKPRKNGQILPLKMDITKKESILAAKDIIMRQEGKLHILVNNAAQLGPMSDWFNDSSASERKDAESTGLGLFNESMDEWQSLYEANTFSVFFVTSAFLGLLAKGSEDVLGWWSTVILIGSICSSSKLNYKHFCYNSSKAAAAHMVKVFATEFALKKIPVRVNTISPGFFPSEMTLTEMGMEILDVFKAVTVSPVPMMRAGNGEEIAGTAMYLASRGGGYVTGQEIVVDGGLVAVNP